MSKESATKLKSLDPTPEEIFDGHFEGGFEVSLAFLHQTLTGPGIAAERTINKVKFKDLQMRVTPIGLLLKTKGKRLGVPLANVCNWYI